MPGQRPSARTGCSPTNKATANSSASATPSGVLGPKRRLAMTPLTFSKEPSVCTRTAPRRHSGTAPAPRTSTTAAGGCADYCVAVYRLMLADAIGYHSALHFGIEHGKRNMVQPDYSSTAFLYTQPDDTIASSDEVDPTDLVSRIMHIYTDSDAAEQMLISTYEGSDDTRTVAGSVRTTQAPITFDAQIH